MSEPEIRTRKTPLMQQMIDAVRAVLGPYDDATLIATIGYCRSPEAAVKRCMAALDILPATPSGSIAADPQALAIAAADEAFAEHWRNATSDDPEVSAWNSQPYMASKQAVLDALAKAFPDLSAEAVYDVWTDCNENAAWCAKIVRERLAAEAAEERQDALDDLDRFGSDGAAAAKAALAEGRDLDETPLTLEEEEAVAEEARTAKPKRTRAPRKAPAGRRSRRNAELPDPEVALATIASDPNCTWPGHQAALDEHGFCSVCQH